MIALLIVVILAIALGGVAAYGTFSVVKSADTASLAQRNAAQLQQAAALVSANLRAPNLDGVAYAPMGSTAPEGHTTLPSWISTMRTPWGVSYGYCPYAPGVAGAGASVVEGGGGTSYGVATVQFPAGSPAARTYVTGSDAPPAGMAEAGVLAIVVSPAPNSTAVPKCSDVALSGGRFLVQGGSAAAVLRRVAQDETTVAAAMRATRFVAPAAAGAGDGRDAQNPTTLEDALSLWQATAPRIFVIRLAAGNHLVSAGAADLAQTAHPTGAGQKVVFLGAGRGGTSIAPAAGMAAFKLPVDADVSGVTFAAGAGLQVDAGATLALKDAGFDWIYSSGGTVRISGDSAAATAGAGNRSIRIDHGALRIEGTLALVPDAGAGEAVLVHGGRADLVGASLSASVGSGAAALTAEAGARLSLDGSALTVTGSPVAAVVAGGERASIVGSSIDLPASTSYGVAVTAGALELAGSRIGADAARPLVAVRDSGAASVSGDVGSVAWAGLACFDGALFQASGGYLDGETADKGVAGTHREIPVRARWTCRR